jgi:hypothetical protein
MAELAGCQDITDFMNAKTNIADGDLVQLAAKAAGMPAPVDENGVWSAWVGTPENGHWWSPLTDDGDALRLAVALGLRITLPKASAHP